jgi:hypothetical protein
MYKGHVPSSRICIMRTSETEKLEKVNLSTVEI